MEVSSLLFLIILSVTISIPVNCTPCECRHNLTICINDGCLEGKEVPEGSYEAFLGIPFAQPPVGHLRFSNPLPAKPWSGILDAKMEKSDCIQKNVLLPNPTVMGSEDCLYLNVYRPIVAKNIPENNLLPVMVFIHSGAFFAGSASPSAVGPQYFMQNGEVILVTIYYRLGALGFLSTGDEHSPGNFGLKDQTLALRWVQSNIRAFGGDENQVTIFGVSAGGASVHLHMISPLSQGLFQKAITMSGTAIAPWIEPLKNPYKQAMKQAKVLGIQAVNSKELVAKLRKVDAAKLVESSEDLKFWSVDPLVLYRLVIENDRTGAFLTQHPKEIWESGQFHHIPWMTGVVQEEGAIRAGVIVTNKELLDDFNANIKDLLPKLMEIEAKPQTTTDSIYDKLKNYYFNGSDVINGDHNKHKFIDMFSDRAFLHPFYKSVNSYIQYADTVQNPVSLYRFAFKGPISYSLAFTGTNDDLGVIHLDDTLYLFGSPFPAFPENSIYSNLTKTLVEFYVSFAKNGRPTHLSKDDIGECNKFHKGPFCDYQEFRNTADGSGFEVRTKNAFDLEMVNFWDDLLQ